MRAHCCEHLQYAIASTCRACDVRTPAAYHRILPSVSACRYVLTCTSVVLFADDDGESCAELTVFDCDVGEPCDVGAGGAALNVTVA